MRGCARTLALGFDFSGVQGFVGGTPRVHIAPSARRERATRADHAQRVYVTRDHPRASRCLLTRPRRDTLVEFLISV